MHGSALTELLKTFSEEELKNFRDFLKSPYYNKRNAVVKLFQILSKDHPDYQSNSISKKSVFAKLYPGKAYNDSSLRVLIHFLTELTEKFMAVNRFESNRPEYYIQLESVFREKGLKKFFDRNMIKALKSLEQSGLDSEDFYFYKYRLENEKTFQMYASNYAKFEKIIENSGWENAYKDLSDYFVLKSMIMYLNMLNYSALYNKEFSSVKLNNAIANINIDEYDLPIIKMYYFLIKMNTDSGHEENFFTLKKFLNKHKSEIMKYDLTGAYVNMGVYCSKRIDEGNSIFEMESFELYKEEIEEKTYMLSDGSMSPLFYRNAVVTALLTGESKWALRFIESFRPELNKNYRDNYYRYCMALYEFHMKKFEAALGLLPEIKFENIYMKISLKILHLQLMFESSYYDTLFDSLENFRHFIKNISSIPENRKTRFRNFQKYLLRISQLKTGNGKVNADIIHLDLSKEYKIINRKWLTEKIDEASN